MHTQENNSQLLQILQEEFPLAVDPWQVIGERLGISATEVLERVRELRESGIIRRIGPVFNPSGMGFVGALFAVQTLPEKEQMTADFISRYEGITHNYKRECDFNIWFTLVAESPAEMAGILDEIRRECQPLNLLQLDAENTYKIKGTFHAG